MSTSSLNYIADYPHHDDGQEPPYVNGPPSYPLQDYTPQTPLDYRHPINNGGGNSQLCASYPPDSVESGPASQPQPLTELSSPEETKSFYNSNSSNGQPVTAPIYGGSRDGSFLQSLWVTPSQADFELSQQDLGQASNIVPPQNDPRQITMARRQQMLGQRGPSLRNRVDQVAASGRPRDRSPTPMPQPLSFMRSATSSGPTSTANTRTTATDIFSNRGNNDMLNRYNDTDYSPSRASSPSDCFDNLLSPSYQSDTGGATAPREYGHVQKNHQHWSDTTSNFGTLNNIGSGFVPGLEHHVSPDTGMPDHFSQNLQYRTGNSWSYEPNLEIGMPEESDMWPGYPHIPHFNASSNNYDTTENTGMRMEQFSPLPNREELEDREGYGDNVADRNTGGENFEEFFTFSNDDVGDVVSVSEVEAGTAPSRSVNNAKGKGRATEAVLTGETKEALSRAPTPALLVQRPEKRVKLANGNEGPFEAAETGLPSHGSFNKASPPRPQKLQPVTASRSGRAVASSAKRTRSKRKPKAVRRQPQIRQIRPNSTSTTLVGNNTHSGCEEIQTSHARDAHTKRTHECFFAFGGCGVVFSGKNERRRHVETQHIVPVYWSCVDPNCSRGKIFLRKDLYNQHLLHRHTPKELRKELKESQKTTKSAALKKTVPGTRKHKANASSSKEAGSGAGAAAAAASASVTTVTSELEALKQKHAEMERASRYTRLSMPSFRSCSVPSCSETFEGKNAWTLMINHIFDHFQRESLSGQGFGNNKDSRYLIQWAVENNILAEDGRGGWRCVKIVKPSPREMQQMLDERARNAARDAGMAVGVGAGAVVGAVEEVDDEDALNEEEMQL